MVKDQTLLGRYGSADQFLSARRNGFSPGQSKLSLRNRSDLDGEVVEKLSLVCKEGGSKKPYLTT